MHFSVFVINAAETFFLKKGPGSVFRQSLTDCYTMSTILGGLLSIPAFLPCVSTFMARSFRY